MKRKREYEQTKEREFGGYEGKKKESQKEKGEENRTKERRKKRGRRGRKEEKRKVRFSRRFDGRISTIRELKSIHTTKAMRGYQNLGVSLNSKR